MLNTKLITKEIAKQIEQVSNGNIRFTFGESNCLDVLVKVNEDYTFTMRYKDYGVEVRQVLPDVEYLVSYITDTTDGDKVTVTKVFDSEESREEFTNKLEKDFTLSTRKL
jgi:hypothetical protein